jgi:hypothetical protein
MTLARGPLDDRHPLRLVRHRQLQIESSRSLTRKREWYQAPKYWPSVNVNASESFVTVDEGGESLLRQYALRGYKQPMRHRLQQLQSYCDVFQSSPIGSRNNANVPPTHNGRAAGRTHREALAASEVRNR